MCGGSNSEILPIKKKFKRQNSKSPDAATQKQERDSLGPRTLPGPSPPNFAKLRAPSAGGAGRGRRRSRPLTPGGARRAAPSRPGSAPLAPLKVCGRPCARPPPDVWVIYCGGVRVRDGHICRCGPSRQQQKVRGSSAGARTGARTPGPPRRRPAPLPPLPSRAWPRGAPARPTARGNVLQTELGRAHTRRLPQRR